MNRETRRLVEREERRLKKQQEQQGGSRASRAAAMQRRPRGERQPFFKRVRTYLHEVRVEMKKVSWPTREQMVVFVAVTSITTIALTLIVFGMDFGLKNGVMALIGSING